MSTDTATLNELIEVLHDGKTFYEEAVTKVKRADLQQLFSRIARTKTAIENDLKNEVVSSGEKPAKGGSFAGAMRKGYAEMRVKLSSDSDAQYVAQLEDFEDRILHSFEDAVTQSNDASVRAIAAKYMPELNRDHNDMRTLKHAIH